MVSRLLVCFKIIKLKGLVHSQIKIVVNDSGHLRNTVKDILDLVQELSVPPLKMYVSLRL